MAPPARDRPYRWQNRLDTVTVKGTSFHQPALLKLVKGHPRARWTDEGIERLGMVLIAEKDNPYDPNAVAVHAEGMVGHLPREMAPAYRPWLAANGGRMKCPGWFVGGTDA